MNAIQQQQKPKERVFSFPNSLIHLFLFDGKNVNILTPPSTKQNGKVKGKIIESIDSYSSSVIVWLIDSSIIIKQTQQSNTWMDSDANMNCASLSLT